ncbi:MAG: hypothetical protein OES09_04700 [Gammaproteobacteria bacterium]|nr:hypothetical protein [Gammaproteobacteria bacterium]
MSSVKTLVVLARRDHAEAMRVAAGLTIFGHTVQLVFMNEPVADNERNAAQAELLELTDIEPVTTLAAEPGLAHISPAEAARLLTGADALINL